MKLRAEGEVRQQLRNTWTQRGRNTFEVDRLKRRRGEVTEKKREGWTMGRGKEDCKQQRAEGGVHWGGRRMIKKNQWVGGVGAAAAAGRTKRVAWLTPLCCLLKHHSVLSCGEKLKVGAVWFCRRRKIEEGALLICTVLLKFMESHLSDSKSLSCSPSNIHNVKHKLKGGTASCSF